MRLRAAARDRLGGRDGDGGAAAGLLRAVGVAANGVLGLSVVLLPWYSLGPYLPSGWQATWWARAALGLALANIVLLRVRRAPLALLASSLAALAIVAFRVAVPPDFGFDFDGLEVPVERRFGAMVGLLAAAAAALAALGPALLGRRERASP